VAITFGILGRATGLDGAPVVAMSLVVFAGAAQFLAVSLYGAGAALLAFGVTDEVFSVAGTEPDVRPGYLLGLEFGAWAAWSGGTVIGYVAGGLLPADLAAAFATGLYALFASIAVWQVRSAGSRVAVVLILSGGINSLLRLWIEVTAGWAFVAAMLVAASVGFLLERGDARE